MKKMFVSLTIMILSLLLSTNTKAQNAQNGKAILLQVGIEVIKAAYKGANYSPVVFAIKQFLQSTSVVDDATEMAQLHSIQQLEGKMIANGYNPTQFYSNLDQYLRQNSYSLCNDNIYRNFYKCY